MPINSIVPLLGAIDVNLMLTVTLSGLLIVFCMLTLLTIVFRLFGLTVDLLSGKGSKKPKMPPAPAPVPVVRASESLPVIQEESEGLSDELIAVIAAAIAACDPSAHYVIRSVKRTATASRPAWNAAGVFDNTRPF